MANLVLPKHKEKYWITYIKQRIKKNKNFLGFIGGQTGSGKSWSSLRIAEELDPEFNIDRCVFGGLELMNLINSDKLKRGSVIVFEEAGIEMNSRNWQSITNKMLNYLLQTFRHRNFVLIFNSPFMDFIDNATRKLFHAEMLTVGIDFKKKQTKLKAQLLQYNSRMQKFYYHRLKVIKAEGNIPINIWRVDKPSDDLLEAYEKKKLEYTNRLNQKIYEELEAVQNKDKKKKDLTEVQQDTLDLINQGMNVEQIAIARGRSERAIHDTMKWLKKKGYKFNPIFDKIQGKKVLRYDIVEPNTNEKAVITDKPHA